MIACRKIFTGLVFGLGFISLTTYASAAPTVSEQFLAATNGQLPDSQYAGWQLNLYGGWGGMSTDGSSSITKTPIIPGANPETDTLRNNNSFNSSFAPGFGVAYDFITAPYTVFKGVSILHDVSIGINAYYLNANNGGDVYLFGYPQMDSYMNYNANISSWRLMLDSEWDFHPIWRQLMPFAEVGIGTAINTTNFKETPDAGFSALNSLNLPNSTRANFAYDLGVGLKMPIFTHTQASLRYLYSNMGSAQTTSAAVTQPYKVNLSASSILFGLTYSFGS